MNKATLILISAIFTFGCDVPEPGPDDLRASSDTDCVLADGLELRDPFGLLQQASATLGGTITLPPLEWCFCVDHSTGASYTPLCPEGTGCSACCDASGGYLPSPENPSNTTL